MYILKQLFFSISVNSGRIFTSISKNNCVFMDQDDVKVHNLAKKERGQYPAILTERSWPIKDLFYSVTVTQ